MTVNERLKQYLELKGINQTDLGKMLNVSRSAINNWYGSKSGKISPEKLIHIIEIFEDINARWLITGKGGMLEDMPAILEDSASQAYGKDAMEFAYQKGKEVGVLEERIRYAQIPPKK